MILNMYSFILNLLNELNKIILCEPLASIILFYSTNLINLVLNLHEYIEDICLFVCKMKFYFMEWALKTVFSRLALQTNKQTNFIFILCLQTS
jgi:hypothetical protein